MIKIPFRIRMKLFLVLSLSIFLVLLMNCREKNEKKIFTEVKGFDTPVQGQEIKMPANPHANVLPPAAEPAEKLSWTLPNAWTSEPGTGMFTARLRTSPNEDALEGGIIVLAGEAGGLFANIERWAGQLGLNLPQAKLHDFVSSQNKIKTKGNLELTLVDFNPLVEKDGMSMLVGITKPGADSYFIKITGPKAKMIQTKNDFIKFCESLVLE